MSSTGELIDTETVTISSEGGGWKRTQLVIRKDIRTPAQAVPRQPPTLRNNRESVSFCDAEFSQSEFVKAAMTEAEVATILRLCRQDRRCGISKRTPETAGSPEPDVKHSTAERGGTTLDLSGRMFASFRLPQTPRWEPHISFDSRCSRPARPRLKRSTILLDLPCSGSPFMHAIRFISETGFPHSAFELNGRHWYGFKPIIPKCPISPGHIDHSDRSRFVDLQVTFHFEGTDIQRAASPRRGSLL